MGTDKYIQLVYRYISCETKNRGNSYGRKILAIHKVRIVIIVCVYSFNVCIFSHVVYVSFIDWSCMGFTGDEGNNCQI